MRYGAKSNKTVDARPIKTVDARPIAGQSRIGSVVEAVTNVLIGWGVNFAANLIVLPAFGYNVTVHDALGIGVVFTVISLARSYCVRRAFTRMRRWQT